VIVDDICDGGRTFLEMQKTIRSERNISIFGDKIYLVVNTESSQQDELKKNTLMVFIAPTQ
jgi:hypothetical protein